MSSGYFNNSDFHKDNFNNNDVSKVFQTNFLSDSDFSKNSAFVTQTDFGDHTGSDHAGSGLNLATIEGLIKGGDNQQTNASSILDVGGGSGSGSFNNNDFHSVFQNNTLFDNDVSSNNAFVSQEDLGGHSSPDLNVATITGLIANGNNAQANFSTIEDVGVGGSGSFNNNDFHSVHQSNWLNDSDFNHNSATVFQLTGGDGGDSNAAAITQGILNGNNLQANVSAITDLG